MNLLDDIPFELDRGELLASCHIEDGGEDATALDALLHKVRAAARPKALFEEVFVEGAEGNRVTLSGVTFASAALRMNLEPVHRAFVFVATCGREADEIPLPDGDFLAPFWMDTIKAHLLRSGVKYLNDYLERRYALGRTAAMSPGSGDATVWPIEQQAALFSLLGDVEAKLGVRLTDSFLMVPNKTVSGIRFPAEVDFRSCQLCRRENCPGRGAPFDAHLWESLQSEDPSTNSG